MSNYVYNGFPSTLIVHNSDMYNCVPAENGLLHKSTSIIFTGDKTSYEFIVPASGNRITIKGITIIGEGVSGVIKLTRSSNGLCILPCYMSSRNTETASGALNIKMGVDEKILITTTDRGSNETFVGVSYIEFLENQNKE